MRTIDFNIGDLVEWRDSNNLCRFLVLSQNQLPRPAKNVLGKVLTVSYRVFIIRDDVEPTCEGTICNMVFDMGYKDDLFILAHA